jgi:hypothetical protein
MWDIFSWDRRLVLTVAQAIVRLTGCHRGSAIRGIFPHALAVSLILIAALDARVERLSAVTAEQARDRRINLAVLRADGILLPFASFDGDDWKVAWPDNLTRLELPASVGSVPQGWWGGAEPDQWRLFSPGGESPRAVKLVAPAMIQVGVAVRLGLRTDHPPAGSNVPPFAVAFPKIGLAIAGGVDLLPITSVSRVPSVSGPFVGAIRSALTEAEERTVNGLRVQAGWKHPFDKTARAGIEPELEAWYRTTSGETGSRVSYIEAVKKYPPQPKDEGCGLETFITGWILESGKQESPKTDVKASVVYCDRDKASYMLPFGHINVRDRTYWIFQMAGRDHEWYAVAEATRNRVRIVAEYFGGGLPPR